MAQTTPSFDCELGITALLIDEMLDLHSLAQAAMDATTGGTCEAVGRALRGPTPHAADSEVV